VSSPPRARFDRRDSIGARALAPLVGVLLLLAVTVALATVVAIGASSFSTGPAPTTAAIDLAVDSESGTLAFDHIAGESIDVDALTVTVAIDEEPLSTQPPVPFVGADGFSGAPTGPFNAQSDQNWTSGDQATVTLASTNEPQIESGDAVTVTLAVDGQRLSTLEETAD
jgi:archaeal type IV pilus assembly protein PilA